MPIKLENRARYPADWPAIRERILKRAGYRCEHEDDDRGRCNARQYAVGHWERRRSVFDPTRERWCWRPTCGSGPHDCAGAGFEWPSSHRWTYADARDFADGCNDLDGGEHPKLIVIVLTIAHLDHEPENCADENLRALCQRHHLAHDHEHHRASAQATRRAKSGTAELF